MVARRGRNYPKGVDRRTSPTPKAPSSGQEVAERLENEFQAEYGGVSRQVGAGRAEQMQANQRMGDQEAANILRARGGDDSALFPYTPTPSINPPRPRTVAAGYSVDTNTLRVKFRNGAVYEYYDVQPSQWRNFQRVKSPGKAINRTFNSHPYTRRTDLEA